MVKQCLICGKELGMMTAKAVTKDKKYLCPNDVNRLFNTDKASKLSIPMKLAFNVSKMTSEEVIDRLNGNTASLSALEQQFKDAGINDLFGTKKEVAELPNIIDLNSETIKYAVSGLLGANTVLVVCTDKRIIFLDKGLVYGIRTTEIPLDMINAVSYSQGIVFGKVSVTNGANTTEINNVPKEKAALLAKIIKEEAANFKNKLNNGSIARSVPETNNNFSQLKELKELLDQGIITQEEFNAKKKQLLGL